MLLQGLQNTARVTTHHCTVHKVLQQELEDAAMVTKHATRVTTHWCMDKIIILIILWPVFGCFECSWACFYQKNQPDHRMTKQAVATGCNRSQSNVAHPKISATATATMKKPSNCNWKSSCYQLQLQLGCSLFQLLQLDFQTLI